MSGSNARTASDHLTEISRLKREMVLILLDRERCDFFWGGGGSLPHFLPQHPPTPQRRQSTCQIEAHREATEAQAALSARLADQGKELGTFRSAAAAAETKARGACLFCVCVCVYFSVWLRVCPCSRSQALTCDFL